MRGSPSECFSFLFSPLERPKQTLSHITVLWQWLEWGHLHHLMRPFERRGPSSWCHLARCLDSKWPCPNYHFIHDYCEWWSNFLHSCAFTHLHFHLSRDCVRVWCEVLLIPPTEGLPLDELSTWKGCTAWECNIWVSPAGRWKHNSWRELVYETDFD